MGCAGWPDIRSPDIHLRTANLRNVLYDGSVDMIAMTESI